MDQSETHIKLLLKLSRCVNLMRTQNTAITGLTLRIHADVAKSAISVSVEEGVATLQGSVISDWEVQTAEDVARSALGVREVKNLLIIDPATVEENCKISEEIREVLTHTRGLRDGNVNVALAAGILVLSGTVDELWKREAAESVARRFGLLHIRNDIIVN